MCLDSSVHVWEVNTGAGIIYPSFSLLTAIFIFIEKRDKARHPRIDYCSLNQITVKNKFHYLFLLPTFKLLQGTSIFSKLEMLTIWLGVVRAPKGKQPSTEHPPRVFKVPGDAVHPHKCPSLFPSSC